MNIQFTQAGMAAVVYKDDTDDEVGRLDPGTFEATLWQMVVINGTRGKLLRSDGVRLTPDSKQLAQGHYRFHAVEAGELLLKASMHRSGLCDMHQLNGLGN